MLTCNRCDGSGIVSINDPGDPKNFYAGAPCSKCAGTGKLKEKVYNHNGKECGEVIGETHCRLEGCTGIRLRVRWKDGKITLPCTEGMKVRKDGHWQIM